MGGIDFGWGKVAFGSCYVPSESTDFLVMIMPGPVNDEDWIVYMHLPLKHINYIEIDASDVLKPLNVHYLKL